MPVDFPYTLDEMMPNFLYRDLAQEGFVSLGVLYFSQTPSPGRNPESFLDAPLSAVKEAKPTWVESIEDGVRFLRALVGVASEPIALVGWSLGAWVALHCAASGKYAALVLISPWLPPGEEIHDLAKGLPPTLVLHGTADDIVPTSVSHHIGSVLEEAGTLVEVKEVVDGTHLWTGEEGDQAFASIVEFLKLYLSPAA